MNFWFVESKQARKGASAPGGWGVWGQVGSQLIAEFRQRLPRNYH